MSESGLTNFGGVFAISTTAANEDLTQSGFEALSYTTVPNIGQHGDTGVNQNVVSYSTWDRKTVAKGKGEANAGDPPVEFLDVSSPGMDLLIAAADVDNENSYAFRITYADGSIEYNRGIVTGPTRLKGRNEDFKRVSFNLGLNQPPVTVEGSS